MNDLIRKLMQQLDRSKTAYHAVACAAEELNAAGFVGLLEEDAPWDLQRGGKYYVIRDGSALIAFVIGATRGAYRVVASHVDSPCLKVKGDAISYVGGCAKLNVEIYGGGLYYSWLDTPLQLAGRIVSYDRCTGKIASETVCSSHRLVIPSLAIHFNREANRTLTLNPQVDLQPLVSMSDSYTMEWEHTHAGEILEKDLYVVNAAEPYLAGEKDEFLLSPRIDNLTSAFASLESLVRANTASGVSFAFLADNEEVGNHTKQGAASDFLKRTIQRVGATLGEEEETYLPQTFMVSCDNAHAIHPAHPEKSDTAAPVKLGGGVVIKHHANQHYTTDAFSAAVFKAILQNAGVPYQDFYMRADMPCGGTLGASSSSQVSVRSVDIGLGQLAMHSATECMAAQDYPLLVQALSAFYEADLKATSYDSMQLHI